MGETLGDYSLETLLGRGAMGAVYRARHRPTGATRAVKVIAGTVDAEVVARFRREAEALARAGGEGVVPIHEIGFDRGRLFIALGFMPGGSLRGRVGKVHWREAVAIGAALAHALARCHAAGLVHRDLKPDNVLFDEHACPRLADFGLVRDLAAPDLTRSGLMVGTPAYMAPEQLAGKRVDARVDVYALGCVIHELIVGQVPLLGRDLVQMISIKGRGRVEPFPPSLEVPRALDTIVDRALAPRADDRYPTADQLARDLELLLEGKALAPGPRASRTGAVALAAAVALAVVAVGAAFVGPLSARPDSPAPSPAPSLSPHAAPSLARPTGASSRVAEAVRQLRLAANDLVAREPIERAHARVDQVLALVPASSLPPEEIERFVAECRKRVEGEIPSVLDGAAVDRFFRPAFAAIRLASRFGRKIEVSSDFVTEATKWAHVFRESRDEDWCLEGLDAFRLAMHEDRRYAKDAGRGASALLRRHKALAPELREVVVEVDARLRTDELPAAVEVQVEFLASDGQWDQALAAVLEAAPLLPSRGDRQRLVYALLRAGWSPRIPVDLALLDRVVKECPDTPEFFILRDVVESSPADDTRTGDLTMAARSDLLEAPMRATAYLRLALGYERRGLWAECLASYDERPTAVMDLMRSNADDSKRHARVLLRLGRQSDAGRVLEETGGDLLPFAREARSARTQEARTALVEKLR